MTTTMTHLVRNGDATSPAATFTGIPFARLVRVEWSKATETRAARWLLAAVAATTVGLMLAPILSPSSIDQTYTSYLSYAATGLSILLPVLAILTLTSEWSQRTVLTTFTQEPRRLRIVTAKITVSLILGASSAVFGEPGPAMMFTGPWMAATRRPIVPASTTPGTNTPSAPAAR